MGKVRPERVKRIAKELIERFPDKFTADFKSNKKLVEEFAKIPSAKLRNRIAGYVTHLVATIQSSKTEEEEAVAETG